MMIKNDIQNSIAFTGKERDSETGYGYFGARYMDHELMTMWLSVDPMADKYPSISPYAYCAWNPVKLVDPNGCEIGDYYSLRGKYLGTDNIDDRLVHVVKNPQAVETNNGIITTSESNIAFTANYETFQEIENVYERTNENTNGQNEECSAIIGPAVFRGKTGWWDDSGPHCNYPLKFGWTINRETGVMEENTAIQLTSFGHISIHSHPFNHPNPNRVCLNTPSYDDMVNVFIWASLNIIVGYPTDPSHQYPGSLNDVNAAFYDSKGVRLGTMEMEAIRLVNEHRKNNLFGYPE